MNRAILLSIRPKWTKMIFDGEKKFDARNKLPKYIKPGMKVYVYETKGKVRCRTKQNIKTTYTTNKFTHTQFNEGIGMVVGEFTVGEIYEVNPENWEDSDVKYAYLLQSTTLYQDNPEEAPSGYWITCLRSKRDFNQQGYTDQKYAIEIKDVIKYDEEWQKSLIDKLGYKNVEYDVFTSPLPITEFVSWNTLAKHEANLGSHGWIYSDEEKRNTCKLTKAPQSFCYVVEKE